MKIRPGSKRKGYSFIEILVVLAIPGALFRALREFFC
ncbi:MAG: prepilin-type N-terminal cleavage/methylation domain-containing protein [Akkermansia sp.]|nr:prepilin-type N-terminal cleavage/methylation domain-containing protein [Akkermansia sp.]